nr:ABC transporter permease [Neptunicella marina]
MWRDPTMLVLILFVFTLNIYTSAKALPETLHKAPIAFVDEDHSQLSGRIIDGFYPPYFMPPRLIELQDMDKVLDAGEYTFVVNIPPDFEKDAMAGRKPTVQVSVDATRVSQAFTGNGYISQIISSQVSEYLAGYRSNEPLPVELVLRARFNPGLEQFWFGSVMELIDAVTMISIILAGAALIREKEHGTVEHLLVMPVTAGEIMISKIWSTGLIVTLATSLSLVGVIETWLQVPIEGSKLLFVLCVALQLFATTAMGIFMATIARSMPQFGLLMILVLLPLQMLSGGMTPRESMPELIQIIMLAAPNTHFVMASQAILYRGAGIDVVWPQLVALLLIASAFFVIALTRFRRTISLLA